MYARSLRELAGVSSISSNEEFYAKILSQGSVVTKACTYIARMRSKYSLEDYEGAFSDV